MHKIENRKEMLKTEIDEEKLISSKGIDAAKQYLLVRSPVAVGGGGGVFSCTSE
jgi:hypothetical protein